jgi:cell division transport system permease protein
VSSFSARLRYFVRDAADEWRHSPGVNTLATATLTAVLFVAALALLLQSNLDRHLEEWRRDLRIEVYLSDEITVERRDALESELGAVQGVIRVEYVDKDEALRRFRNWFSGMDDVLETLGDNPLPASFEVYLGGGSDAAALAVRVAEEWGSSPGVEEIRFDRDWLDRLEALLTIGRVGGLGLAVVVLAAVVFVMASVLRLAVYARRDEIEIMLLVGASPSFVRGPFLVAGLFQGLVAAGVALTLVEVGRRAVLASLGERSGVLLSLISDRPLGLGLSAAVIACGIAVGFVGSYFAVRRNLNPDYA